MTQYHIWIDTQTKDGTALHDKCETYRKSTRYIFTTLKFIQIFQGQKVCVVIFFLNI